MGDGPIPGGQDRRRANAIIAVTAAQESCQ